MMICWFGFVGFFYERVDDLRAALESQTTGPQTNNYPLVDKFKTRTSSLVLRWPTNFEDDTITNRMSGLNVNYKDTKYTTIT